MEGGLHLTGVFRITKVELVLGEQCFPHSESMPRVGPLGEV